jgi:4-amino-4-deoxy-L-arabinose transferase-like glycosyltransferase
MNAFLMALALATLGMVFVITPTDGGPAIILMLPLVGIVSLMIFRLDHDRKFILSVFLSAVLVRVFVGTFIYAFHLQEFFGGDALTYDFFGNSLLQVWQGQTQYMRAVELFSSKGAGSGWGMLYLVAVVYKIVGQNMLATQFVNCVIGGASAPLAYLISIEIFPNKRIARICALMSAFFPSLVLWSCQGLKDGPIIFLLALSMLATLKLGEKFSVKYVSALVLALVSLLTLRFYVFYIVVIAVTAAFILGRRQLTAQSFARQMIIIIVIGLGLGYFGVNRYAEQQFETFGTGEQLQRMRLDASQSAASGFGEDLDVSTVSGALGTIPLGLTYLLLAPFPWQLASVRQAITLPEMIIWWTSLPFLVLGVWFTIKHRLREIAPIVIFTTLLTLTYSIMQGNVGTAYRQRAQLLVFYFVFVAVGFVLVKERREAKKRNEEADVHRHRGPQWPTKRNKGEMPAPG